MHVLLSAFNMSYKEFGDVRLCFLKTVSFDLWLLISKEKPSIHLTFTFGDELLEHSALLIVSLNLYENFSVQVSPDVLIVFSSLLKCSANFLREAVN